MTVLRQLVDKPVANQNGTVMFAFVKFRVLMQS
jgi:hypothetical protein